MGTQGGRPPWALGALAPVGVGDMDGTGPCALETRGVDRGIRRRRLGCCPPPGILQEWEAGPWVPVAALTAASLYKQDLLH